MNDNGFNFDLRGNGNKELRSYQVTLEYLVSPYRNPMALPV